MNDLLKKSALELAVLGGGRLGEHLVAVHGAPHHVLAPHVGERDRVGGGGNLGSGNLGHLGDGVGDCVEFTREARDFLVGQCDMGQARDAGDLVSTNA